MAINLHPLPILHTFFPLRTSLPLTLPLHLRVRSTPLPLPIPLPLPLPPLQPLPPLPVPPRSLLLPSPHLHPAGLEVRVRLLPRQLLIHQLDPLVLAPPARFVDVELAGARAGARALHVGDDLRGWGEAGARGAGGGGGDVDVTVGFGEEGVEVGGLLGRRSQGTAFGRALGAGVLGRGDRFGDGFGHGLRCGAEAVEEE